MLELYFDGSCEPVNPGGTGKWGFVIKDGNGMIVDMGHGSLGRFDWMTNNIAEYAGLLNGLKRMKESHDTTGGIKVYGDSLMVVNMANGTWGKKRPHKDNPRLLDLLQQVWEAMRWMEVEIRWIPRGLNIEADRLSKMA